MRLALVGPTHPYKGGIAQHTTQLAHRLAGAGHEVDLVSWRAQYPAFLYPGEQRVPQGAPDGEPFPATSYPLSWWRPDGWWRTGRSLRSYDAVVVVHVTPFQVPAYLCLLAAARRQRASPPRVVAVVHNVLPHEQRPGDRRLVTALLSRVEGVVVHSEEQASLAARHGAHRTEVCELPPHLGSAVTTADPSLRGDTARRLLFFGLIRPYKGLDVLLRSLATVPDVFLVVAGEFWGGVEETREMVRTLGLSERVDLRPGYVPAHDVPGLFADVDALVLPYRSATSSGNIALAFEHRTPVVASAVGDLPRRVRHGVDGLLVLPADPGSLAEAIRRLYEPGVLKGLRSGVEAPDPDASWRSYVTAVTDIADRPPGER